MHTKTITRTSSSPWRWTAILLILSLLLAACQAQATGPLPTPEAGSEYPNGRLLVSPSWLTSVLNHASLRIIDMRAPDAYAQSHIPGAVNVPVATIASTVDGIPFEFDRQQVQDALDKAGLQPDMTVVIYDDLGMMNAARLFWTLEYVGHQDVRILNGGWNAWEAAGLPVTTESPRVTPSAYPIQLDESKLVSARQVLQHLDDPQVILVDARSPREYTGEARLAQRGGHIPGAVNLVWLDALTGGDTVYTTDPDWQAQLQDPDVEVFKSAQEIQALLDARGIVPDKRVITYCQTLWRGAHVYFLLRLMGFENVAGYDGSWAEWGNRSDLPVTTGPNP